MLKTSLLCTALGLALAACSNAPARNDSRTAATPVDACPSTGSRVQSATEPCRSYSKSDVDNTGKPLVGDSLGLLDPSITVHH